ncbi:GTPase [Streptomyces sp. NPDC018031]|uniref:GTPase n=1 Tax=Streptomyces sp. NPDC018031 TaxID=3365033 RepID=UPI0037B5E26A
MSEVTTTDPYRGDRPGGPLPPAGRAGDHEAQPGGRPGDHPDGQAGGHPGDRAAGRPGEGTAVPARAAEHAGAHLGDRAAGRGRDEAAGAPGDGPDGPAEPGPPPDGAETRTPGRSAAGRDAEPPAGSRPDPGAGSAPGGTPREAWPQSAAPGGPGARQAWDDGLIARRVHPPEGTAWSEETEGAGEIEGMAEGQEAEGAKETTAPGRTPGKDPQAPRTAEAYRADEAREAEEPGEAREVGRSPGGHEAAEATPDRATGGHPVGPVAAGHPHGAPLPGRMPLPGRPPGPAHRGNDGELPAPRGADGADGPAPGAGRTGGPGTERVAGPMPGTPPVAADRGYPAAFPGTGRYPGRAGDTGTAGRRERAAGPGPDGPFGPRGGPAGPSVIPGGTTGMRDEPPGGHDESAWEDGPGGGGVFGGYDPHPRPGGARTLRPRLDALRELIGLSRSRLDRRALAEAGRVLDEAAARGRYSLGHTVVALAGATGSGKSSLFNALAGVEISRAGVRRPTTAEPVSCAWTDHADGLLDRLGIAPRARHRPVDPYDQALRGLVLLDLPDHDSAAAGHRERVDRLLGLVDAVVWVVDPEKYADAVLHERYLRPLAGYAEVTFVVLNQVDRLPGDAADQVLDDLRRLLDEDGLALGEHGEPGATVMSVSALTGRGVGELRETLGRFVGECGAAERRLSADVDGATGRLRPCYVVDGGRAGLTERARTDFEDRLADAAGAGAVGQAAERVWLRAAHRACGLPWGRLRPRRGRRRWRGGAKDPGGAMAVPPVTARSAVDEAVRTLADEAATGLPGPWAQAVRDAARRGARGLPEAVDEAVAAAAPNGRPDRPAWWTVAASLQVTLLVVQLVAVGWLLGVVTGGMDGGWWLPALLFAVSAAGGPAVAWGSALAARGPARTYGDTVERRLRDAASGCGRARVLEPVAAELLRYREVREKYAVAAAG